jgi:hypothetical protein
VIILKLPSGLSRNLEVRMSHFPDLPSIPKGELCGRQEKIGKNRRKMARRRFIELCRSEEKPEAVVAILKFTDPESVDGEAFARNDTSGTQFR